MSTCSSGVFGDFPPNPAPDDVLPIPVVVLMNLISNAIDASKPGDVVTITTRSNGDEVQIEVADAGVGIEPTVKDRIFDPFFTTKPQGEGVGLGLSISYAIVQDHQGRIEVESTLGEGSRFIVHLPLSGAQVPS